ncbi:hypothetical protein [Terriglobus sp. RCC_193]|uniref:hypothetical protein n=1 Tax=Terriglobus sp. RCC_193 TaxID=3239218 RepID=UPI003525C185
MTISVMDAVMTVMARLGRSDSSGNGKNENGKKCKDAATNHLQKGETPLAESH